MDKRIVFLKKQMLSNLRHTPTTEKMARSVELSKSYLQQLFQREVKMSPVQYLKQLRLETARDLLENSFKQVKQIGSCYENCISFGNTCYQHCVYCHSDGGDSGDCFSATDCNSGQYCGGG